MPSRFEIDYNDPSVAFEPLVNEVFSELKSSFLEMPRGDGYIEYATFERGYQALKRTTNAFVTVTALTVEEAVVEAPISFIVFRAILGFTPPEWAYVTTELTSVSVDQGAARSIDRNIRLRPLTPKPLQGTLTDQRIRAMIDAGVRTLLTGANDEVPSLIHRLNKADTREGLKSLQPIADLGVPYPVLLYERFLGRPFASHRDSVSELVGELVEGAIKVFLPLQRSASGRPSEPSESTDSIKLLTSLSPMSSIRWLSSKPSSQRTTAPHATRWPACNAYAHCETKAAVTTM